MLVVRVEIHPLGDERQTKQIERIDSGNVGGPNDSDASIYAVIRKNDRADTMQSTSCVHCRSDGALVLVAKALAALGIRA